MRGTARTRGPDVQNAAEEVARAIAEVDSGAEEFRVFDDPKGRSYMQFTKLAPVGYRLEYRDDRVHAANELRCCGADAQVLSRILAAYLSGSDVSKMCRWEASAF